MNRKKNPSIAYFSMEIGIDERMPTYSGGLGVLAGDTIRSAADLGVPMVAVSLLYRKGYFHQKLDSGGWQTEEPSEWKIDDLLKEQAGRVPVTIEGRTVWVRSWEYVVNGVYGHSVPVYFLDADLPENSEWDRTLTHHLYGGNVHYRLCQEVLLGIGGVKMLRTLGFDRIKRFHMNEGHAALLTLELLEEEAKKSGRRSFTHDDIESVRAKCVFTTHTPVPAGHDHFPMDLVYRVLGHRKDLIDISDEFNMELVSRVVSHAGGYSDLMEMFKPENSLNMTYLALNLSGYVNGVAKKHGEVSRLMFAGYEIDAITNGVHAATWASRPFAGLFDSHIPEWRRDNYSLRYALSIPRDRIWKAHTGAKHEFLKHVSSSTGVKMDPDAFTIGFARRAATYKRGDLLFTDIDRLKKIALHKGPLQIIFAGKAHPQDQGGKEIIRRIFQIKESLKNEIKIAYLENYDIRLGKLITSGVDIWLNTPLPPLEASGTSGMKAAINGVPSLSILDGWWIEGHIEGVTGWAIETGGEKNDASTARSLYEKLEHLVVPTFYSERDRYINIMAHSIALNGSFFNTHRMMQQYVLNAYFL